MVSRARGRTASRDVIYRRGSRSMIIRASLGRRTFDVESPEGVFIEVQGMDFIFDFEDLDGAGIGLPETGDEVTFAPEGAKFETRYRALRVAGGGHYEFIDTESRQLRLHTKLVEVRP